METITQFTIPGVAFALTLAFGFWLSRAGKPYNGLIFNGHKLIALASVIITVIEMIGIFRNHEPLAPILFVLLVLAALSVVALFVSGALMSANKLDYAWLRSIHRLGIVALVIVMAAMIYSLLGEGWL